MPSPSKKKKGKQKKTLQNLIYQVALLNAINVSSLSCDQVMHGEKKQMMMFILFFQLEQHSQILFYVCNSLVDNVYNNFFDKRKITFRPFFSKVQLGIRDFWNRGKQAAKLAYHASLLPWISLANEMTTRPLGKIRPAHSPFQMIKLWRTVYYEMKNKTSLE